VKSQGYKYAGSNNIDEVAWYDKNSGNKTQPVGQKKANELGLYDMSGNVWEWCWDWFGDYPSESLTDPKGLDRGSYRVYRGGSWNGYPIYARVAGRLNVTAGYRVYSIGFRLARAAVAF
jgi:formylglycine-generating enzyme